MAIVYSQYSTVSGLPDYTTCYSRHVNFTAVDTVFDHIVCQCCRNDTCCVIAVSRDGAFIDTIDDSCVGVVFSCDTCNVRTVGVDSALVRTVLYGSAIYAYDASIGSATGTCCRNRTGIETFVNQCISFRLAGDTGCCSCIGSDIGIVGTFLNETSFIYITGNTTDIVGTSYGRYGSLVYTVNDFSAQSAGKCTGVAECRK